MIALADGRLSRDTSDDLAGFKDFVFNKRAGEGVYIYVLDRGVATNVQNVS